MNDIVARDESIRTVHPEVVTISYGKDAWDKDGNNVILNEEKITEEINSKEYIRKRAEAYPTWQEQMDLIYHSGVAGLKAELKKTKDKYPKG